MNDMEKIRKMGYKAKDQKFKPSKEYDLRKPTKQEENTMREFRRVQETAVGGAASLAVLSMASKFLK